jgi:hypothetical protein
MEFTAFLSEGGGILGERLAFASSDKCFLGEGVEILFTLINMFLLICISPHF